LKAVAIQFGFCRIEKVLNSPWASARGKEVIAYHGLKAVAIQFGFCRIEKVLNSPWASARGKRCHRLPRLESRGNSIWFL